MGYTKEQTITVVTACARAYQENLVNKTLLFVCLDKHKRISCIELTFDVSNFLHLTGLKMNTCIDKNGDEYKLSATEFFNKCLKNRLSIHEFDFSSDGTSILKLEVLPSVINKNLSASMVGNYNSTNPKLYTEKLVGGIKACVGFVPTGPSQRYVPNTILKADIRDYTKGTVRVVAVFRKEKQDSKYSEVTYRAKKVEWDRIKFPEEFAHLCLSCVGK